MKIINKYLITPITLGNTTLKIICAMLFVSCGCSNKTAQVFDSVPEEDSKTESKESAQSQDSAQNVCGDAGSECQEGKRVAKSSNNAGYSIEEFTPHKMTYDDASGK